MKQKLAEKIEKQRALMVSLVESGAENKEVLKASQRLDRYIVLYQKVGYSVDKPAAPASVAPTRTGVNRATYMKAASIGSTTPDL